MSSSPANPPTPPPSSPVSDAPRGRHHVKSDIPFFAGFVALGVIYVALIIGMIAADVSFTSLPKLFTAFFSEGPAKAFELGFADFADALSKPEIRFAVYLSLITCTLSALLSLVVAIPVGYLMSRFNFFGKNLVDAVLDIPIVLPPLVIGISLLILFQTTIGKSLEDGVMGAINADLVRGGFALTEFIGALLLWKLALIKRWGGSQRLADRMPGWVSPLVGTALVLLLWVVSRGRVLHGSTDALFGLFGYQLVTLSINDIAQWLGAKPIRGVTYDLPSVVLAQFAVACAFAVRTMRVTFDQIDARRERVALTLGCSRGQAFRHVVLPEAQRGSLTALTLAWARSMGEFGPILVFSGATRMKTEVLPTTVFLELSVGDIGAAVTVSMLMVTAAVVVLMLARMFGLRRGGLL